MSDQIAAMFRRRPNHGWFRAGRFDVTTTDIICALAVASMFLYGISSDLFNKLGVRSRRTCATARSGGSSPGRSPPNPTVWGLLGIVFFWLFGQQLEALFGRGKFVAWVLARHHHPGAALHAARRRSRAASTSQRRVRTGHAVPRRHLGVRRHVPGVKWFEVIPLWALAAVFTVLNLLQYTGTDATGTASSSSLASAWRSSPGRRSASPPAGRSPTSRSTVRPVPQAGRSRKRRSPKKPQSSSSSGHRAPARRATVVEGPWRTAPAADAAAVRPALGRRPGSNSTPARQDRRHRHGLAHQRREEAPERPQQTPPQPLTPEPRRPTAVPPPLPAHDRATLRRAMSMYRRRCRTTTSIRREASVRCRCTGAGAGQLHRSVTAVRAR